MITFCSKENTTHQKMANFENTEIVSRSIYILRTRRLNGYEPLIHFGDEIRDSTDERIDILNVLLN